jgi:hypothetical protein
MTILVHLLSVTILTLFLTGIWHFSLNSFRWGHFLQKSFAGVTREALQDKSQKQIRYDINSKVMLKTRLQGGMGKTR